MGMCANSLELGCDCLGLIRYFDAHLCDSRGEPLTIKNADLHARGRLRHPLEAHRPPAAGHARGAAVAAAGRLVDLDGRELRVRLLLVPLPGRQHPVRGQADRHPLARRAASRARSRRTARSSRRSSTPRTTSTSSTCGSTSTSTARPTPSSGSTWCPTRSTSTTRSRTPSSAKATPLKTEKQARGHLNLETARTWKIVNPNVQNAVGEPVGYKFLPGDNSFPFASPNAWWRKRAGLREPPRLGDAVRRRREVRGRRLPEPEPGRRRPDRSGPSRTGRSRTPTSCSGTPSATRTSRGRRTTR